MMDGIFTLLSLCVFMAAASFLAGILPLSLTLSQSQLRLISTIGMGVLVGTSLIVIIPEGVEALYSISESGHHRARRQDFTSNALPFAGNGPQVLAQFLPRADSVGIDTFLVPGPAMNSRGTPPPTPTTPGVVGTTGDGSSVGAGEENTNGKEHNESHHAWIGVALIAGFIMMYLIDKIPQYTTPAKPRAMTHHIALNNLGRRFNLTTAIDRDEETDGFLDNSPHGATTRNRSFATTIGLVIHAAADGIALGASSSSSNSGMSFIIFFAIMVHKAPAAFGLTSVLLKQGLSKRTARAHLALFSLAAPVGAICTWFFAHLLGSAQSGNSESTHWWTGMLLLFSAGTFLYVAMHSMQETSAGHHELVANGHINSFGENRDSMRGENQASLKDLGAACFGMILPLFLQVGHAH